MLPSKGKAASLRRAALTEPFRPLTQPTPNRFLEELALNYRHHFHAGNFADLMKHAILLELIAAMRSRGPLRLIETHAGAGLYDLEGDVARRTGEAEAGVGRLMTAAALPAPLEALRQAVLAENADGKLRLYPGSPLLALGAMRTGETYMGYELRPDDFESLRTLLSQRTAIKRVDAPKRRDWTKTGASDAVSDSLDSKSRGAAPTAKAFDSDGYAALETALQGGELVLIDPPYERGDDYDRVVEAADLCIRRGASLAIWAPLKDLESLDALTRRIEALSPRGLELAEVRLRPLRDPMKMNGSVMLLVDAPEVDAGSICTWVAEVCGDPGGLGRARRLAG
jgi:23S rRNA (adenine2030-N6)-methyltransferase